MDPVSKRATLTLLFLFAGVPVLAGLALEIRSWFATDCEEVQMEMYLAAQVRSPEYMDLYRQWRDDCKPPTGED